MQRSSHLNLLEENNRGNQIQDKQNSEENIQINDNINNEDNNNQQNTEKEEEEEEPKYETGGKRNLMFEEQKISPMKLYCHLSNKCEVILMVFGFIGSMGAGVAAPLMINGSRSRSTINDIFIW